MEITGRQFIRHLLTELTGIILVAIGGAGIMKVALGTGAYDAMSLSVSSITSIPVGTIGMMSNSICIVIQIVLLKKKYHPLYLLQIPVSILLGVIINLFYYQVLAGMHPQNYVVRLAVFMIFMLICIFGDAMVSASGMIGLALESTCMILAKKYHLEFGKTRQAADILFLAVIIVLWLMFHAAFAIREGTLILAICFGPLLGRWTKKMMPVIHHWIYRS